MRLIDADKLSGLMYHEAFETDTKMQRWDSGNWIRYKLFEKCLEKAPTVDAEPVRHGHWMRPNGLTDSYRCECSYCGEVAYQVTYKYCPHCGAKMDEKENEK